MHFLFFFITKSHFFGSKFFKQANKKREKSDCAPLSESVLYKSCPVLYTWHQYLHTASIHQYTNLWGADLATLTGSGLEPLPAGAR